jgi:hypothetical protein
VNNVKPHMLIYKKDNGKEIVTVGVTKRNGKWGVQGNPQHMPVEELEGWLNFLESQGHTLLSRDIDFARRNGTPLIVVAPGKTKLEAIEGAAWWTVIMHQVSEDGDHE